jgi:hypothetical protein
VGLSKPRIGFIKSADKFSGTGSRQEKRSEILPRISGALCRQYAKSTMLL